jgi:hypothetical protein
MIESLGAVDEVIKNREVDSKNVTSALDKKKRM